MVAKQLKISVIVPIYNSEKWIYRCVNSILLQTIHNIEVLLIDDGSDDNSLAICKKIAKKDKRVKVFSQKNRGPGAARNRGIRLARGQYVCFCDSDDFLDYTMLERLYKRSKKNHTDITICDFYLYFELFRDVKKAEYQYKPASEIFSFKDHTDHFFQIIRSSACCALYNLNFLKKHSIIFDETSNTEDRFFTFHAAIVADSISYLNYPLYYYTQRASSRKDGPKITIDGLKTTEFLYKILLKNNAKPNDIQSFFNYVLDIFFAKLNRELYPTKLASLHFFKESFIPKFHLLQYKPNYWYVKSFHNLIQKIAHTNYPQLHFQQYRKIVPIVYTTNQGEIVYTLLSVQSIIANISHNNFYDIYILHNTIQDIDIYKLKLLSDKNVRITCVDISTKHIFQNIDIHKWKLLAPIIFKYDQIIFPKNTIIFEDDIAKLFTDEDNMNKITTFSVENKISKGYCLDKLHILPNEHFSMDLFVGYIKDWEHFDNNTENISLLTDKNYSADDLCNILFNKNIIYKNPLCKFSTFNLDEEFLPHFSDFNIMNKFWEYARITPFYETILYKLKHSETILIEEKNAYQKDNTYFQEKTMAQTIENDMLEPIKPKSLNKIYSFFKIENPLISVIIIHYDYSQHIQRTLDSLLNQSYKNFEIIVIDSRSENNAILPIEKYTEHFSKLSSYRMEDKSTLSSTLQTLLSKANGKYIAFCDSGDIWLQDHLEEYIKVMRQFSNPPLIINNLSWFGNYFRCKCYQEYFSSTFLSKIHSLCKLKMSITDWKKQSKLPPLSCWIATKSILKCCNWKAIENNSISYWILSQLLTSCLFFFIPKKLTYTYLQNNDEIKFYQNYYLSKADEITQKLNRLLFDKHSSLKQKCDKRDNSASFSIIMPTFNRSYCIEKAINSVLESTYQNFELIIVDDGSTDKTEDLIIEKYADFLRIGKIKYIKEKHMGVARIRNVGFSYAKNDWIAFADSDNLMTSVFLEKIATVINKSLEQNNLIFYGYILRVKHKQSIGNKKFDYDALKKDNYIDLNSLVFHKKLYQTLGGFDITLSSQVDWELILRYSSKYRPIFVDCIASIYNDDVNDQSRISNRPYLDINATADQIRERYKDITPDWA